MFYSRLLILPLLLACVAAVPIPSPASQPTYEVTGGKYETLLGRKGLVTVYQATVKVTGGAGGGAVKSAKCGNVDVSVPDCVTGIVGGSGGSVVLNMTSSECAKQFKHCEKLSITLADGSTFQIGVPNLFFSVQPGFGGDTVVQNLLAIPVSAQLFDARLTAQAYAEWMAANTGTLQSLPPAPVFTTQPFSGKFTVSVATYNPDGSLLSSDFATLLDFAGNENITATFPLLRGKGYFVLNTTTVPVGSTVTVTTSGVGFDSTVHSVTVQ
jgi:hypothetical protein